MMGWRRAFESVCVSVVLTCAAAAQTRDQNWAKCNSDDDDQSIAGCTAVIQAAGQEMAQGLAQAYTTRGRAYWEKGITTKSYNDLAIRDFDTAISLNPDYAPAFADRGTAYSSKNDHARAIQDLNEAIRLDPTNARYFQLRAYEYDSDDDHERAMQDFDQAIRLKPGDALLEQGRESADAVAAFTHRERTIAGWDRAIQLNPKDDDAIYQRGLLYAKNGQADLAMQDYNRALQLNPDSILVLETRGRAYFSSGDCDRAIDDFSRAISIVPDFAVAFADRCLARAVAGKLDLALADCNQTLSLFKKDVADSDKTEQALFLRGFVYTKMKNPSAAIVDYNAALALSRREPLALYGRGIAEQMMGKQTAGAADIAAGVSNNSGAADLFKQWGVTTDHGKVTVMRRDLDGGIFAHEPQPEAGSVAAEVLEDLERTQEYIYLVTLYKDKSRADSEWANSAEGLAIFAELKAIRNDALQTKIINTQGGREFQYCVGGQIVNDPGIEVADLEKSKAYRSTIEQAIAENILTSYSFPGFPGRTKP